MSMLDDRGSVHALLVDDEQAHTNCYHEEMVAVTLPFLRRALSADGVGIGQQQLDELALSRASEGERIWSAAIQ